MFLKTIYTNLVNKHTEIDLFHPYFILILVDKKSTNKISSLKNKVYLFTLLNVFIFLIKHKSTAIVDFVKL